MTSKHEAKDRHPGWEQETHDKDVDIEWTLSTRRSHQSQHHVCTFTIEHGQPSDVRTRWMLCGRWAVKVRSATIGRSQALSVDDPSLHRRPIADSHPTASFLVSWSSKVRASAWGLDGSCV